MMHTFTPKQYLKIDIANSFGLDGLDWDKRIQWFDENENRLLNLLAQAENAAQFYAGIKAWEDVKAGRPTGYAISLDATSSGIQILSVLTGDRLAAALSNVLDTGHRSNAYTALYVKMGEEVEKIYGKGKKPDIIKSDLKQAIMTAFYGSEAVPKNVFGEGKLLKAFFQTLEKETPFVWELNKAFLNMWNPTATKYSWMLPDNFHVHIKVMDKVQEIIQFMGTTVTTERMENKALAKGRSLGANVTHSVDGFIVRELIRRCSYDPSVVAYVQSLIIEGPGAVKDEKSENGKMVGLLWNLYLRSGFLSARILKYLDPSNIHMVDTDELQDLIDSLPAKPFNVLSVHDCFKVHPNYANDLRKQYNLQLSLIAKSNMLSFVLSQVTGKPIKINKQADMAKDVLDADYALS